MTTWLVLDVSYLCRRAFHVTPRDGLAFKGVPTNILHMFLRDVLYFQDTFATKEVVFCFDCLGKTKREHVYPAYKAMRRATYDSCMSEDVIQDLKNLRAQVGILRESALADIGFRNVFVEEGYEADDLIASVCQNLPNQDEAVIVSSDHDLYQLLSDKVSMFNPVKKQVYTQSHLRSEYGLKPCKWALVKAIAGCRTDGIVGVRRIGEKTAAAYLNGTLDPKRKTYQDIETAKPLWKRNLSLVRLPYEGTPVYELKQDETTRRKWDSVTSRYGLKKVFDHVLTSF